jgi:hypothetical protein
MNLIQFKHRYDFGHEYYVQILNTGKHFPKFLKDKSLFQFSVSWNDYTSWPYIQITSGSGTALGILFWAYKFGFDIDVLSRTWSWDHLENLDEDKTELV